MSENCANSDKRLQILQAAQRVLAELGIENCSMQQIAKEAGVAAGTLYCYFQDKSDLLYQLHRLAQQEFSELLFGSLNNGAPLFEQYNALWHQCFNHIINDPDGFKCFRRYELSSHYDHEQEKREKIQTLAPWFRFLDQGVTQGLFKPLSTEILSSLSLETALSLAQKQLQGKLILGAEQQEAVIAASWDAITLHHTPTFEKGNQ